MPTEIVSKPQEENPMLEMIRAMGTFDAHRLVEAMQKWAPWSSLPGFDMAGWTAIQEKNAAALQSASREMQTVLSDSASRQLEIIQEWTGNAVRAADNAAHADTPFDAAAKEIEFAVSSIGEASVQGIGALKTTTEKLREIANQLGTRWVDATAEMKKIAHPA